MQTFSPQAILAYEQAEVMGGGGYREDRQYDDHVTAI